MRLIRFLAKLLDKPFYQYLMRPLKKPMETQRIILSRIIKINKNTQFGKKHKFNKISSIQKFQEFVKPQGYEYFRPYIDSMVSAESDVLIRGNPIFWGRTAGSTGVPKLIPITARSIRNATRGTLLLYLAYIAENPQEHSKFLDGTICFFNANPAIEYINKIPVGFGTGIFSQSSQNRIWSPFIRNLMYSTGHLFKIRDIKKRYLQMTREISQRDIRVFSGVTTVVLGLLEVVLDNLRQKNQDITFIKDIFPNYQFSILGGESPQFYEKRLFSLVGKKIDYREVYGATEEIIGVQLQEAPGLTPLVDANFLEFIPLNSEDRLLIHEVEKNIDYQILLTNFNGLYAYKLGDVIKFTSVDPPLFIFSHRQGTINLASEKMTVRQIIDILTLTNEDQNCGIVEYCVIGKYTPKPHYIFIIEFLKSHNPKDYKEYLKMLNQNLIECNPVYREQLLGINALKEPILWIVKSGTFHELETILTEDTETIGQHKIQHLSTNEKLLKNFQDYVINVIELN